jgi:hypothetical protein
MAGKFGVVEGPLWHDRPVAIIGGGPSLNNFDFNRLRGAHVLAVKGSIFTVPWADAGYGMDFPRYREWKTKLAQLPMRVYWAVPDDKLPECIDAPNITYLKRKEGQGISDDPDAIFNGGTSGFGALQIALLKKARKIVLLGFDYNGDYRFGGKGFHHNPEVYEHKRRQEASNWSMWASYFSAIEWIPRSRGVEVLNACHSSSITAFPKIDLDEAVRYLQKG